MFQAHVRTVNVVWPEYDHSVEASAPEVQRHDLTDQLRGAIRVPRVEWIWNGKRYRLVGGDTAGRLVCLRAGRHDQLSHALPDAAVDDVDDAFHAHVQHHVRLRVEELRPVDSGQMHDALHALDG